MRKRSQDIYYLGILGVIATLPFDISINSLAIILFLLSWINLLVQDGSKLFNELKRNRIAQLMILFGLFYACSALMRYSLYSNFDIALKDLELRASFVIFPVGMTGIPLLSKLQIRNIFKFYVGIIFFATLICLVLAVIATLKSGSVYSWDTNYHFVENHFMYHRLTSWIGVHAIYFSAYVSVAFFIVFDQFIREFGKEKSNKKYRSLRMVLLVYFIVVIFLLNSISISIAFLLALVIVGFYYLLRNFHLTNERILVSAAIGLVVILSFGTMIVNKFNFKDSVLSYDMEDEYPNANWNSLNLRLAKWEISFQVLEEVWLFGVGPGNIIDILDVYYEKNNFRFALQQHYNPHNQFLHTFIVLGVIGIILLTAIYSMAYVLAFRRKDILFGIFLLIFSVFSMSESILAVNKGVVFFTFFLCLFSYLKTSTSDCLDSISIDTE